MPGSWADPLLLEGRSKACQGETELSPTPVHRRADLRGTVLAVGEGSTSKRFKTQMNFMISVWVIGKPTPQSEKTR